MIGHFAYAAHLIGPHPVVIRLKTVIEAILPQPDRHQIGPGFAGGIDAALGQVDRLPTHGRIGRV